ncbi:MAG TPA: hypothetical protein VHL11_15405, partial [Phototrophicaceae bacterium]|nr:hypothetical protein [Phototrophicaceae bacterium]
QSAKPDSKRLGVTGELSWLGGKDDAPDESAHPDARTGVTGQLDWRKTSFEDQLEAAEKAAGVQRDLPPLDQDQSLFEDTDQAEEDEIPDWLRGSAPAASATDFNLDDLTASDDESNDFDFDVYDQTPAQTSSTAPTGSAETPSWLTDMDDTDDEDADTAPWLAGNTAAELEDDDYALETDADDTLASLFENFPIDEDPTQASVGSDDFDLLSELTSGSGSKTGLTDLLGSPDAEPADADSLDISEDDFYSEFMAAQDQNILPDTDDDSDDWLQHLDTLVVNPPAQSKARPSAPVSDIDDVDDFLASLDTGGDLDLGDDLNLDTDSELNFDDLFADQTFDRLDRATASAPNIPTADAPDWLANVSSSEVSAAALVRKQADRPVEELSDRLQLLRENADQIPSEQAGGDDRALRELIPDLKDALASAPVQIAGASGIADKLNLSAEQSRKAALLTALTGASAAAASSTLSEIAATPLSVARRQRLKIDRLAITLLIAVAVILPFFGIIKVGDLPASTFSAGSPQQIAFDQIDSISKGRPVLFAAEYGATGAGELDDMTDVVLRHMVLRQLHPVIVSSNPVGLLRAQSRMENLAGTTLKRNTDYFIGRYIPGANIGLRGFSQDIANLTGTDLYGNPTGLQIT